MAGGRIESAGRGNEAAGAWKEAAGTGKSSAGLGKSAAGSGYVPAGAKKTPAGSRKTPVGPGKLWAGVGKRVAGPGKMAAGVGKRAAGWVLQWQVPRGQTRGDLAVRWREAPHGRSRSTRVTNPRSFAGVLTKLVGPIRLPLRDGFCFTQFPMKKPQPPKKKDSRRGEDNPSQFPRMQKIFAIMKRNQDDPNPHKTYPTKHGFALVSSAIFAALQLHFVSIRCARLKGMFAPGAVGMGARQLYRG